MRNSFIQMSKLTNVKGRISYIASHVRQENLYAVYETTDRKFWHELAKCNQEEFRKSGTEGKCIEARELIIALPEDFVEYDSKQLLVQFTDYFKQKYEVECLAALHHNKKKTNYHIHLIFSERRLLDESKEKIATRNRYYDENGRYVRTKKEVINEAGKLRSGCYVIRKGEIYEKNTLTTKDSKFKQASFLNEVKLGYTELINMCVQDENKKLKVFCKNSPYLPTKKIGKNNPKTEMIEEDNRVRMKWNHAVDRAYVSGIPEKEILRVKNVEISDKIQKSFERKGENPSLFRMVIEIAVMTLELVITKVLHTVYGAYDMKKTVDETIDAVEDYPEKPESLSEYNRLRIIADELSARNKAIYKLEIRLDGLEKEIEETKGIFRSRRKKVLQEQIFEQKMEIDIQKGELSKIVQKYGFPTVKIFYENYQKVQRDKTVYECDLNSWKDEYVPEKLPVEVVERLREKDKRQVTKVKKKNMKKTNMLER